MGWGWNTTSVVTATILKDNQLNQHLTVDEESTVTGLSVKLDGYKGNPDDLTITWSHENMEGTNYGDEGGQFPDLTWALQNSQNTTLIIPQVFKNWEGELNVEIKDASGKKVASTSVDVTILNSKNEAPILEKGIGSGWYENRELTGEKALVGNNVTQAYSGEKVELSFSFKDPNPGDAEHLIFRFEQTEGVEIVPHESRNDYDEFCLSFEAPRVTQTTPVTLKVIVCDTHGGEDALSQTVTITPSKTGRERLDEMAQIARDPNADRFDRRGAWYNLYQSGDARAPQIFATILGEPNAEMHLKTHLLDFWMEDLGNGVGVQDWNAFRNHPIAVAVRSNAQARAFFANQEGMQIYADTLGEPYRPYSFVEVASIMMSREEYTSVLSQFISNRVSSYTDAALRGSLTFLLEKLDSLDPQSAKALAARIVDEDFVRSQDSFSRFDHVSYYLKPFPTSGVLGVFEKSTNPYLLRDAMDELRTSTDWEVSNLPLDFLMDPRFAKTELDEHTYDDEESADLWKVAATFAVDMDAYESVAEALANPDLTDDHRSFLEEQVTNAPEETMQDVVDSLSAALTDWPDEEQAAGNGSLVRLASEDSEDFDTGTF